MAEYEGHSNGFWFLIGEDEQNIIWVGKGTHTSSGQRLSWCNFE